MKENHLIIECLESRIAPAGVVNVAFAAGKLILTGDVGDNDVSITQDGPKTTYLTGNAATTFASILPLTVFDPATGVLNGVLKDVAWTDTLGGADALSLTNMVIPGSVSFSDSAGASAKTFTLNTVKVGGKVDVTTGAGSDFVNFFGDFVTIGKDLTLTLGDGNNSFQTTAEALKVGGSVNATSGTGDDSFSLRSTHTSVKGKVNINAGAGANDNEIGGTYATIGGLVSITNGDNATGNDTFNIFDVGSGNLKVGGIKIINGNASAGSSNQTAINGTIVSTGPLTVTGGTGNDSVNIDGFTNLTTGPINVAQGDGVNSFMAFGGNVKLGSVNVTSGQGNDIFSVDGSTATTGKITVNAGAGANTNTVSGGALTIGGLLSLTNGDNATGGNTVNNIRPDFLKVTGISVTNGNASGGSANSTFIDGAGATINGALTVAGGTGNDTVDISEAILSITGKTNVTQGAGLNSFGVHGTTVKMGAVSVLNDAAASPNSSATIDPYFLKILGGVTFTNANVVSVNTGGTINGPVQIQTIAGDGNLFVGGDGALAPLKLLNSLKITGTSVIADTMDVGLKFASIGGATTIGLGDANTSVTIDDIHASKQFDITTGAGVDTIDIERAPLIDFPLRALFDKIVNITTGGGVDTLSIGSDTATEKGIFKSQVNLDGGAGIDIAHVSAALFGNVYALAGQPVNIGGSFETFN